MQESYIRGVCTPRAHIWIYLSYVQADLLYTRNQLTRYVHQQYLVPMYITGSVSCIDLIQGSTKSNNDHVIMRCGYHEIKKVRILSHVYTDV